MTGRQYLTGLRVSEIALLAGVSVLALVDGVVLVIDTRLLLDHLRPGARTRHRAGEGVSQI